MQLRKVIIVEDEVRFCDMIKTGLNALSDDLQIYPTNTANEALEILRKEDIDVLITDIRLPGTSGLELLEMAKDLQDDLMPIVITGHGELDMAIKALQLGAINFIRKPFAMEVLLHSVKMGIDQRDLIQKLKVSEERFRSAFFHAAAGIMIFGLDGKMMQVNQSLCQMLGYSESELLSMKIGDLEVIGSDDSLMVNVNNLIMGPVDFLFMESRLRCKSGKERSVNVSMSVVKRDNSPEYLTAQVIDTTELHEYRDILEQKVIERTEELNIALHDAEKTRDQLDGIQESMADGMIVTDLNHVIQQMNPAAEEFMNVKREDILNRNIDFIIHDKELLETVELSIRNQETGYQFDFEMPAKNTDSPIYLRARTSVIRDKNDRITHIIYNFHDVSQEREVDRMKTEFISTAAHELRSPLTSIKGFSEILMTRNDLGDNEKSRFLNHINTQANKLSAIINDLLDISRIESGTSFTLEKELHDLRTIIDDVLAPFEEQDSAHDFQVRIVDSCNSIMIDGEKMGQVFKNLVSNSVKYSPDGGTIHLECKESGGFYNISVRDEGIGMTEEQVARIFDKFYRADASRTAVEGTGLGMSIAKYIIEEHGGTIQVESEPDQGTIVSFTIPKDDKPA